MVLKNTQERISTFKTTPRTIIHCMEKKEKVDKDLVVTAWSKGRGKKKKSTLGTSRQYFLLCKMTGQSL